MVIALLLSFIFGTIIGSFLNVLILRLPEEQSIGGRSHCMYCKHELAAADLVPIFSYLFLRGKCRYCGKKISSRYFFIETITGLSFALAYAVLQPNAVASSIQFARALFIISALVVIFMIDFEHYLILDKVILPASIILFFFNLALDICQGNTWFYSQSLMGVATGLAIFIFFGGMYYFSKGKAIGFGDVKFSFFLGLATPLYLIVVNMFLSFMIGAIIGIALILANVKKLNSQVPFGTFLSVSTIMTVLFGQPLLSWYLKVLGIHF